MKDNVNKRVSIELNNGDVLNIPKDLIQQITIETEFIKHNIDFTKIVSIKIEDDKN